MSAESFRFRPAKRGFGTRRKELIELLRQSETCFFHSTIMCSGQNPPAEWVKQKEEFEAEVVKFTAELEQICGPENQKKLDKFLMK